MFDRALNRLGLFNVTDLVKNKKRQNVKNGILRGKLTINVRFLLCGREQDLLSSEVIRVR